MTGKLHSDEHDRRDTLACGPTVWEASRFCTAPGLDGRERPLALLRETIGGVIETALLYGIEHIISALVAETRPESLRGARRRRRVIVPAIQICATYRQSPAPPLEPARDRTPRSYSKRARTVRRRGLSFTRRSHSSRRPFTTLAERLDPGRH